MYYVCIFTQVLELGAGTGLPGILASLCGAQVTLSDSAKLPHCLEQCQKSAEANGVSDRVKIVGLTWGAFSSELIKLKGEVDILLGSDVFYDPVVFEDLLCTVSYILESNPSVCVY
jgi:predicted nicotinamide N-methyase